MEHLDDGEFLNDTIIDFFLLYFEREKVWKKAASEHFHVYTTFFYTKLQQEKGDLCASVQRWTKLPSIFDKKFLLIPINQHLHWTLAVVCWAGNLMRGETEVDMFNEEQEEVPCILYFDSLGGSFRGKSHIYKYLNFMRAKSLGQEGNDIKKFFTQTNLPLIKAKVPEQENMYDCGLFVLEYAKRLMKGDADRFEETVKELQEVGKPDWFTPQTANKLRDHIRSVIQNEVKKRAS